MREALGRMDESVTEAEPRFPQVVWARAFFFENSNRGPAKPMVSHVAPDRHPLIDLWLAIFQHFAALSSCTPPHMCAVPKAQVAHTITIVTPRARIVFRSISTSPPHPPTTHHIYPVELAGIMRFILHPVAALSALLLLTPQLVLSAPAVAAVAAAQAEAATAQIAAAPPARKIVKCFKNKDFVNVNYDAALTDICVKSDTYKAVCPQGLSEPDWNGKGSNTYCDTCTCVNP
ncbi:hypothetical protein QBC39DRAFT_328526 [Podospora conica]|nr:hypothetical protein QBC39DRAFT_328526 [Schizothecium conicum]